MEESKKERVGGPFALSPKPRPFAIFSSSPFLAFSQLSEGLLHINYVLHLQIFMVYIQLERRALLALCYLSAETDLVVLTFQLLLDCETVTFFFLFFFASIFSIVFYCFYCIF